MQLMHYLEQVDSHRRVYFHLVDDSDGMAPALDEAGGQPQISLNGAAFTSTGISTLTHIGNGRYYALLTAGAIATPGTIIETRYKSDATKECPGGSVQVVGFNPDDANGLGLAYLDVAVSSRMPNNGIGAGSVTYTVYDVDGTTPVPGVTAYAVDSTGHIVATGVTNSSGLVSLQIDLMANGNVFFHGPGRIFDGDPLSMTLGQVLTRDVQATATVVAAAAPPNGTLYATLRGLDGTARARVTGTVRVQGLPALYVGSFAEGDLVTATSDSTGLIQWTVPQGAALLVSIPLFCTNASVTMPEAGSADLADLL